jgi:ribulose-5-phosphate 4-epimerase/fuculose-1-phosphate aldolase
LVYSVGERTAEEKDAVGEVPPYRLETFAAACRRAAALGLVRCSSGNLSARLDEHRMLVTASQAWMAHLATSQVALCRIADATPLTNITPSVESRFHAATLHQRRDMNAVLHFQSPCATVLACGEPADMDFNVLPEIPYYIGPVAVVPYLAPGTAELADAVTAALRDHDLCILRNHGQVTVGTTPDDAIQKAAFFELACEIILRAGDAARPLSPDEVMALQHP